MKREIHLETKENLFDVFPIRYLDKNLFTLSLTMSEYNNVAIQNNWEGIKISGFISDYLLTDFICPEAITKVVMFSHLKQYDVNFPYIVKNYNSVLGVMSRFADGGVKINNDTLIAIRPSRTAARGLGNLVMKFSELELFLSLLKIAFKYDTPEKFNKLLEGNGFNREKYGEVHSEDDIYFLENAILNNNILIQEVVEVKEEYRLYWHFGMKNLGDLLILKRDGYGLNVDAYDMSEELVVNTLDLTKKDFSTLPTNYKFLQLEDKVKKEFVKTLNKLIKMFKDSKFMVASIDIYIDSKDNVGAFEFSTEFAMDGLPLHVQSNFITELNNSLYNYKK